MIRRRIEGTLAAVLYLSPKVISGVAAVKALHPFKWQDNEKYGLQHSIGLYRFFRKGGIFFEIYCAFGGSINIYNWLLNRKTN